MNESKTVYMTDLAKSLQSQGIPVISLSVGELIGKENKIKTQQK